MAAVAAPAPASQVASRSQLVEAAEAGPASALMTASPSPRVEGDAESHPSHAHKTWKCHGCGSHQAMQNRTCSECGHGHYASGALVEEEGRGNFRGVDGKNHKWASWNKKVTQLQMRVITCIRIRI